MADPVPHRHILEAEVAAPDLARLLAGHSSRLVHELHCRRLKALAEWHHLEIMRLARLALSHCRPGVLLVAWPALQEAGTYAFGQPIYSMDEPRETKLAVAALALAGVAHVLASSVHDYETPTQDSTEAFLSPLWPGVQTSLFA
ncbi:MAG: hypothetical protein AAGI08_00110 [Bacteroidota bacterium]